MYMKPQGSHKDELTTLCNDNPQLLIAIMDRVREYYRSDENRELFEKWYKNKYGKSKEE